MEDKKMPRKVTESVYGAVKFCLESNSIAETARFTKLSGTVVSMIQKSESFEDYKRIMFETSRKCHGRTKKPENDNPPEEVKANVTVQASRYMEEKMGEMCELLKGISAKLAVIIDDLYGTNKTA